MFEGAYSPFSHLADMCSIIKTVVIPKAIRSLFNIALCWYQVTKTIKSTKTQRIANFQMNCHFIFDKKYCVGEKFTIYEKGKFNKSY